jgi:hypothetical protein
VKLTLQDRFANFVSWIRPDPDKAEDVRKQRDNVKASIKAKAEADGLVVKSMPASGSFAKATGLRRHMLGGAEHEGQDVDCPFVLDAKDEDGDPLTTLLPRFEGYAAAAYPDTERKTTKSSVQLTFAATKTSFDLVPMLAVSGTEEEQILLRAGGERRRTSVQRHVEFIQSRTKRSRDLPGRVTFNEGVRLTKWWRDVFLLQTKLIEDIPSFLLELLCAKAFDEASVGLRYADSLVTWFDRIHAYAAKRTDITFTDFGTPRLTNVTAIWRVIDPVNSANNAVPTAWGNIQIDELRDHAAAARDKLQQAMAFDLRGRDTDAVALVSEVFGTSFSNHSEG